MSIQEQKPKQKRVRRGNPTPQIRVGKNNKLLFNVAAQRLFAAAIEEDSNLLISKTEADELKIKPVKTDGVLRRICAGRFLQVPQVRFGLHEGDVLAADPEADGADVVYFRRQPRKQQPQPQNQEAIIQP